MHDETAVGYLQRVLLLDPREEAQSILNHRNDFLDGVIPADLVDDSHRTDDSKATYARQLAELRQQFWSASELELTERLSWLSDVPHANTAIEAARLQTIAQHRRDIKDLGQERGLSSTFYITYFTVLISPPSEANQLRERELSKLRPEQNPKKFNVVYNQSIQRTANLIKQKYPTLYALEEAWLNELLDYDANAETKYKPESLGRIYSLIMILTIFIIVTMPCWIF